MLTTTEAARRLGVKPETLYAYVSRGLLTRQPEPGARRSLFDAAEVELLAARSRRGRRPAALELVVDTALTLLDPDGALFYRGEDATHLARTSTYEAVAELLWGGDAGEPWTATPVAGLPDGRPADRLRAIVALAAAGDPLRADLRPAAVRHTARGLIATMVDGLPALGEPAGDAIAARLWSRLHGAPPTPERLRVVDAALILLADHELALSALAARIVASAHADPYLVVLAGLAAQGGALHGAAGTAVERLLASMATPDEVPAVLGERLAAGQQLPGFGHAVYRGRDPRAETLLALLATARPDPGRSAILERVLDLAGPAPNVDLALGAVTDGLGLVPGSAQAIFAVARSAGLIAHALEEYPHRLRFRARATYVGPTPGR